MQRLIAFLSTLFVLIAFGTPAFADEHVFRLGLCGPC